MGVSGCRGGLQSESGTLGGTFDFSVLQHLTGDLQLFLGILNLGSLTDTCSRKDFFFGASSGEFDKSATVGVRFI